MRYGSEMNAYEAPKHAEQKSPAGVAKARAIRMLLAGVASTVLPLSLGFLTTVAGLIASFVRVSSPGVDPSKKAAQLAEGISLAMNATYIGLGGSVIGIGILVAGLVMYARATTALARESDSAR